MNTESIKLTYDRYSTLYDLMFGVFFFPGRKKAISLIDRTIDTDILEVGVGTGASLKYYPKYVSITGIDISDKMLSICNRRIKKYSMSNVCISNMDAENLDFNDNSFSHVMAMYIVSVCHNPSKLLEELMRVCKPGGQIIIVNHFSHVDSFVSKFEKALLPLSARLGFKPYFPIDDFLSLPLFNQLEIVDRRRTGPLGYWTILKLVKK